MPLTRKEISQRQRDRKASSGLREVRHLFVPSKQYEAYRGALKAFIGDIDVRGCFSCDKEFIAECHNDREEGYFCDDCLDNKDYKWEAKK